MGGIRAPRHAILVCSQSSHHQGEGMRTVIGLLERADQARVALDDIVEFGAVQEQITLLVRRDDSSAFARAIADYRSQANGAAQGGATVLLITTVRSTF